MQILNTLYVTQPESWLRLDNATVCIEVERQLKLRVPLHHLHSIVCFGHVGLSAPLMHRLADERIGLVLLDSTGRFKARLEGPTAGNVLTRVAQRRRCDDASFSLRLARAFVVGKVRNARQLLLRAARESRVDDESVRLGRVAADLAATVRALPTVSDLNALRGFEGEAARGYFAALNIVVKADCRGAFAMVGRSRRPPRDAMNALLSFLYALWMNDCRSAIEAAGLDPQQGFLHALRPGRAALALDLMEEFRPLADRLALTLINRAQLSARDFVRRDAGAWSLADSSRKAVLVAYQQRKQEPVSHPLLAQPVPSGLLPMIQARLLARAIREGDDGAETDDCAYVPFLVR